MEALMQFGEIEVDAKDGSNILGFWIVFVSIVPILITILFGYNIHIKIWEIDRAFDRKSS